MAKVLNPDVVRQVQHGFGRAIANDRFCILAWRKSTCLSRKPYRDGMSYKRSLIIRPIRSWGPHDREDQA